MSSQLTVKKEPCLTCPYRLDVPSGVWSWEEYEKLRGFTDYTNINVFLCHQSTPAGEEIACKGWLIVEQDSVAVRLACARRLLEFPACFEEPDAKLHETGAAAADFGQRDIERPGRKALKLIRKLEERGFGGSAKEVQ